MAVAAAVTVAVVAVACSTGDGPTAANSTPSPLPCDPDATPQPGPRIVVAATGSTPRTPLRYQPAAGRSTRSTAAEAMSTSQSSGAQNSTDRQTARVTYTATIRAVCDQVFTRDIVYGKPEIGHPAQQEGVADSRFALLDGLVVREARTSRGLLVAASRSAPAGVDPASQNALDDLLGQLGQSTVVFPEQPVGIGARWASEQFQTVSGITLNTRTEYTLTGRTAREVTLAWSLTAGAAPQVAQVQGRSVSLDSYEASGSGTLRVDLAAAATSTGQLSLSVRQHLRADATPVRQQVDETVTVSTP